MLSKRTHCKQDSHVCSLTCGLSVIYVIYCLIFKSDNLTMHISLFPTAAGGCYHQESSDLINAQHTTAPSTRLHTDTE